MGYRNVGLTLATYNKSAYAKIAEILQQGGNIRLVKGLYSGDITDWDAVTDNYLKCAKILIDSKTRHTIATHDFEILSKLYYYSPNFVNTINLAFFYDAESYVNSMLSKMPFTPRTTFYLTSGDILGYVIKNGYEIDKVRSIKRVFNRVLYNIKKNFWDL